MNAPMVTPDDLRSASAEPREDGHLSRPKAQNRALVMHSTHAWGCAVPTKALKGGFVLSRACAFCWVVSSSFSLGRLWL